MDRAELSTTVRSRIAAVLGVPDEEITEDVDLRTEHDVDSLELMEIGARLEMAVGVRLQVEDLIGIATVGGAVDVLQARLRGSA